MANTREPILQPIPILSLRPTQMTVGMREVKEKRKRLREYWKEHKSKKKQGEFLGHHMIPVVLGPDKHHYVVDHHHLARALHDEGVKDILVTVIGDLTMVERDAFWGVMDNKQMGLSLRRQGRTPALQGPSEIDHRSQGRSVPQPRRRIAARPAVSPRTRRRSANSCGRISCAVRCRARAWTPISKRPWRRALALAKSKDAIYLPGWCGPASDD